MAKAKSDSFVIPQAARILMKLSHADRLRIVELLKRGPQDVQQICNALSMIRSTAATHLTLMAVVGILNIRVPDDDSRRREYSLKGTVYKKILAAAEDVIEAVS